MWLLWNVPSSSGLLFVDENLIEIDISELNSVTLMCNLAGYNADATEISWSFEGQRIISGTNGYLVSVANRDCPPYGTCSVGLLGISNLTLAIIHVLLRISHKILSCLVRRLCYISCKHLHLAQSTTEPSTVHTDCLTFTVAYTQTNRLY